MNPTNQIIQGDALAVLKTLDDECVNMCITSPPYWGLRDYGVADQLGLESTPEEYVANMVEVFRLVRELLADDGSLWLNLGDSYATSGSSDAQSNSAASPGKSCDAFRDSRYINQKQARTAVSGLKPKDLLGMPWRVAFALQADGWYLRSDIIWAKPNPMPESVTDRPTKSHEYLFLLSKQAKYYYDAEAIKEPGTTFEGRPAGVVRDREYGYDSKQAALDKQRGHEREHQGFVEKWDRMRRDEQCGGMRNKRSVWTIATQPYAEAHFATFPEALVEPCILAGSRTGDIVLDPFFGSGTVGQVAQNLGRNWIGIELNPEYEKLQAKRTQQQGMML